MWQCNYPFASYFDLPRRWNLPMDCTYIIHSTFFLCSYYSSWVIQLLIWAVSLFFCIWNYDETQSQCFWVNMMMGDTWPYMIWGWLFRFTLWSWEQKGSLLTGIVLLETSVEVSQELSFLCTISFHVIAFLFYMERCMMNHVNVSNSKLFKWVEELRLIIQVNYY